MYEDIMDFPLVFFFQGWFWSSSYESARPPCWPHINFWRKAVSISPNVAPFWSSFYIQSVSAAVWKSTTFCRSLWLDSICSLLLIYLISFLSADVSRSRNALNKTALFCLRQGLLIPCQCWWADAACAVPSWCSDGPWDPAPCPPDQHPKPWRSGVCCHHQQPYTSRLHWRQGLCEDLGHQPAW